MPQKARARDFSRGASEQEKYDYLVNSSHAIEEIQRFHKEEDILIATALKDEKFQFSRPFVVLEEGCGPGRIIEWLTEFSFAHRHNAPKYIIGVDFEWNMISNCAKHLVGPGGLISDWRFESVARKLAGEEEKQQKRINDQIRDKVILIQADMTKPHLFFNLLTPVVIVAFGTLGNVVKPSDALTKIYEMISPGGFLFLSVFNRKKHEVGSHRYDSLAQQMFLQMKETSYDRDTGAFGNKAGFYSKWFNEDELLEILEPSFRVEGKIESLADEVGFAVWLRPRRKLGLEIFFKQTPNIEKTFKRIAQHSQTESGVCLRCPKCGHLLENSLLPLKERKELACSNSPSHTYDVREIQGFFVPVLEAI